LKQGAAETIAQIFEKKEKLIFDKQSCQPCAAYNPYLSASLPAAGAPFVMQIIWNG
jgi:hypothetical protein